jgi:hypothetical protein
VKLRALAIRLTAVIVGLFVSTLIFQNCGKVGFEAKDLIASSSSLASITPTTLPGGPNGVTPTTLPISDNTMIGSKAAGTTAANCLTNNSFDACIFWKNPVAQRERPYPAPGLLFGTNLAADQTFGVQLNNLKTLSYLESDSLYVYASTGAIASDPASIRTKPRLLLNNGSYKANYGSDGTATTGNKSVAQLMAYFWLDHMATELTRRVGPAVYPKPALTYVDAYSRDPDPEGRPSPNLIQNAFFTFRYCATADGSCGQRFDVGNRYIFMGFSVFCGQTDLQGNCTQALFGHEMALSSEVYLHEMGHGNFLSKVGAQAIVADTLSACPTAQGCFGAINEGQADFHTLMIFTERGGLGETIGNNLTSGMDPSRNATSLLNQQRTVAQFFNLNPEVPGQIHNVGAGYAAILWRIYSDPRVEKRRFESAFFLHLQMLSQSATFATSWSGLIAQYLAVGGSASGVQAIDEAFTAKGVRPSI